MVKINYSFEKKQKEIAKKKKKQEKLLKKLEQSSDETQPKQSPADPGDTNNLIT